MKQVKTKRIQVEYTNGEKIVILPYKHEGKQGFGYEYYDKKGKMERYEGGFTPERIANWFREILEDDITDNADYDKEFDRIQMEYSSS